MRTSDQGIRFLNEVTLLGLRCCARGWDGGRGAVARDESQGRGGAASPESSPLPCHIALFFARGGVQPPHTMVRSCSLLPLCISLPHLSLSAAVAAAHQGSALGRERKGSGEVRRAFFSSGGGHHLEWSLISSMRTRQNRNHPSQIEREVFDLYSRVASPETSIPRRAQAGINTHQATMNSLEQ
jgi:hypothetical protein